MSYPKNTNNPQNYRIRVQGKLDDSWSVWFDGMVVESQIDISGESVTTLSGWIPDQSALHGILNKIRNMGLKLLSVEQVILNQDE